MELWIIATFFAAILQTIRFMLQKLLSQTKLTTAGATFSRFCFSAPFLWAIMLIYFWSSDDTIPALSFSFWSYAMFGGLAQIFGTLCVVALFRSRNFAVGVAFKKTEVIQAVLVGVVLLHEGVSPMGLGAILIGLWGVLLFSDQRASEDQTGHRFLNRATGLGLASGLFFAISAVSYRGATLQIDTFSSLLTASVTLCAVLTFQFCTMGVWIYLKEPRQFAALWRSRGTAVWVGLTSLGGSLGWFVAFTVQNAAYVKALGQTEIIFSLAASYFFFKERITRRELTGVGLLVFSILILILVA